MRQIGFKNFRRFEDFPSIDLAPITIFVGENNAGKSTVVKGILALSDFLNSRQNFDVDYYLRMEDEISENDKILHTKNMLRNVKFRFNTSYLAHIGTYRRALYNNAEDSCITFKTNLGYMDVSIDVVGNRNDEESVSGNVSKVSLFIQGFNISMDFDLIEDIASIAFHPCIEKDISTQFFGARMVDSLKLFFSSFDKEYRVSLPISNNWRMYRGDLISSLIESLEISIDSALFPVTKEMMERGEFRGRTPYSVPAMNIDEETLQFLRKYSEQEWTRGFSMSARREMRNCFRLPGARGPLMRMVDIEYIYAHAVTQTVIYSAKDSNDYLSRTIHEFAPLQGLNYKRQFVIDWMKEFGIGTNFTIRSVGGEAHIVYITNGDGKKVNLADKGMGSIQLMVLLFRLAITLPKREERNRMGSYGLGKVVIVEEPEQNLHPKLQSKLADMFHLLQKDYGYRFIIETHSEYLVRRSQVIVADENKKAANRQREWQNPFKVFYFPAEGYPYDMEYATDGYFERSFGKGFFNVSSELSLDLDRIEQGVYNEGQN